MKKHILTAAICSCLASGAIANDLGAEPSAMLYMHVPFGGETRQANTNSFGMRLDWVNAGQGISTAQFNRPGLFDLRLQNNQLHDVRFSGIPLVSRDQQTNDLTLGGLELTTGQAIGLGVVVGGTIMCLTETEICEGNDAPPPSEGGGGNQNQNQNQGG